ncbi:MAG: putative acriflavin resistance protein [Chloroflexi bacterium]|nr:putative acriflavin resistance protein [Chloroflexota bacterium]
MGLTRLSVHRPLTVLMGILAAVLMGGVAYTYMKVDRLPPLNFPVVFVNVTYPQASAQDVEQLVTKPIEDAVSGVAGIESISSTSSEGFSNVRIQFVPDADANLAALDIDRRLSAIRNRLPVDTGIPSVRKADPNSQPIMNIALTGAPLDELYDVATTLLAPQLQSVLGVAIVNVTGGLQREIQVKVDYAKLAAYNLSVSQISTSLAAANVASTVGANSQGSQTLSIRAVGRFETPEALRNLIVAQTPAGSLLLRDVATVSEGYKDVLQVQRLNVLEPGTEARPVGEEAVGLSIVKDSSTNALQVADNVRAVLDKFQRSLPEGAHVYIRNDSSTYTRGSLNAVQKDLILAVLLVGGITLLFLHSWRNALIILLSIPTSMISSFLIMYALGFTINLMTLMALALMVGILVDSSIVVIENIHRHLQQGKSPRDAAISGRAEIGMATIAIALADIVVYVPIAFMSGAVGQLFRQYGLTVVGATILSLLVSFTLTPMLASRWMRHEEHDTGLLGTFGRWWDARFDRVAAFAERLVPVAVRGRWAIVAVCLMLVGASYALIQFRVIGTEYVPAEDDGNFNVNMSTPPCTSLEGMDRGARQMEAYLSGIEEVRGVFASVSGSGSGVGDGGGRANIAVQLVSKEERQRPIIEIMNDVRQYGRQIPGTIVRTSVPSPLGGGAGSGISINVSGPDLDVVKEVAGQIQSAASGVAGLTDLQNSTPEGNPELRLALDGARMAQVGVTGQQVMDALRITLGGRVVSVLRPDGKPQLDITLIASDVDRQNLSALMSIPVRGGATAAGGQAAGTPVVTLGQVATLTYASGPVQIQRVDRNRTISVSGNVSGRALGDVATDLKAAVNTVPLPPGYVVTQSGSVNQLNNALAALAQAIGLALILEYMLLVALYGSFFYPLVLMLAVPLGLVGSIFGLAITGNTINIFSLIGLIMGFGLVAKNGILLVDYANQQREAGMERTAALAASVRARLRPILMTSATMVGGMMPLAMKTEAGAESRAPMAVVVIGAIITSTILAVVVIPAVYTLLDDLQNLLSRRRVAAPELVPVMAGAGGSWSPMEIAAANRRQYANGNGQANGNGHVTGPAYANGAAHANGAAAKSNGAAHTNGAAKSNGHAAEIPAAPAEPSSEPVKAQEP